MKHLNRITALIEMLKNQPEDLFLNYALGLEHISQRAYTEAETQFKKVISLKANHLAAYYQLAKLFEEQQKNDDALFYYKLGLEKAQEEKDNKTISEFKEAIFLLDDSE